MSCLNCYTLKMCTFGIHWSSTDCANSIVGSSKPYCNPQTNKCTNIKPDGCPSISTVSCLRDDVFPEPSECTIYYQCMNGTADLVSCPNNYIYKPEFGKCVFKLSDKDCTKVDACGPMDFMGQYPGDPSLYYSCRASIFHFEACSPSEIFNATSEICESRCDSRGLLSISQNCVKYYRCEETENGLVAIEETCPDGYGFNPIKLSCEKGYSTLCNELAIIENDIYEFLSKIPVINKLTRIFKSILNLVNLNPIKIIFIFRWSDDDISRVILVVDYIYQNKRIPPNILPVLLKFLIERLPYQVQFVFNILSQLGIIKLQNPTRLIRSISEDLSMQHYIEDKFSNITNALFSFLEHIEAKNTSEINEEIIQLVVASFNISEEQIPIIMTAIRNYMPLIVNRVNHYIGWPFLIITQENNIGFDVDAIDLSIEDILNVIALYLSGNQDFDEDTFKMSAREQYYVHRDEIKKFLLDFKFNLSV